MRRMRLSIHTTDLLQQLNKVIISLEESYKKQPTSMVEMLLNRYRQAIETIETNAPESLTKGLFKIRGGVRSYLEAASDYMNPVLEEMNVAERMLEKMLG